MEQLTAGVTKRFTEPKKQIFRSIEKQCTCLGNFVFYFALVQSFLNYRILKWGSAGEVYIKRIVIAQKAVIKLMLNNLFCTRVPWCVERLD